MKTIMFLFAFFSISILAYAEEIKAPDNFLYVEHEGWKKALDTKISVEFKDTHLRDVLNYVSKVARLNIILDDMIFNEEGKITIPKKVENIKEKNEVDCKLTIKFENIKARDLLWYICKKYNLKARWSYGYGDKSDIPHAIFLTSNVRM